MAGTADLAPTAAGAATGVRAATAVALTRERVAAPTEVRALRGAPQARGRAAPVVLPSEFFTMRRQKSSPIQIPFPSDMEVLAVLEDAIGLWAPPVMDFRAWSAKLSNAKPNINLSIR